MVGSDHLDDKPDFLPEILPSRYDSLKLLKFEVFGPFALARKYLLSVIFAAWPNWIKQVATDEAPL
jgi:hypothetical protein